MSDQKDHTQYRFQSEPVGKGRLVLSIIKAYVANHPNASYDELKDVFPDALQARSDIQFSEQQVVFAKTDDIEPKETKRFFLKQSELINLSDCQIAVSKEWNHQNIQIFIAAVGKLGYAVSEA